MAISKMVHLSLLGLQSEMPQIINQLSQAGVVEIHRNPEMEQKISEKGLANSPHAFRREIPGLDFNQAFQVRMAQLADPQSESESLLSSWMTDYPRYIAECTRRIDYLDHVIELCDVIKPVKKSIFDAPRLLTDRMMQSLSGTQTDVLNFGKRLEENRVAYKDLRNELSSVTLSLQTLEPFRGFVFSDAQEKNLHTVSIIKGSFPNAAAITTFQEKLDTAELREVALELLYVFPTEFVSPTDSQKTAKVTMNSEALPRVVSIAVYKGLEDSVLRLLQSVGFQSLPEIQGLPTNDYKAAILALEKKKESLQSEIEETQVLAKDLTQHREAFENLSDFYSAQLVRLEAMNNLAQTGQLFVLEGWMPLSSKQELLDSLDRSFTVDYFCRDAEDNEEHPVLLKNTSLVKPYEAILEMYSMPDSTKDLDPTKFIAPFYAFFFGMMLSDMGYGLLMAIFTGLALWKYKIQGSSRKLFKVLFDGSIFAILWGLAFGSFFGNLPGALLGLPIQPLLFDPIQKPIPMMALSIVFGVIHIFLGMGLSVYLSFKKKEIREALTDVCPWYFIFGGLGLYFAGSYMIGLYLAGIAALVLVFLSPCDSKNPIIRLFKGLLKLYDVTGFFSDFLSYTRILALSLATAVIAMVVNQLAGMLTFNFIGWILAIPILLLGHGLNLALSGLGAYVHTTRLQYVEFFGRFYTGGGDAFQPLAVSTKYTKVVAEKQLSQKR